MTLETCGSKRLLKSYVKIDKRRDKKNLPCDFYPTRCVFSKTHNSLDKIISKCKPGGILYISFDAYIETVFMCISFPSNADLIIGQISITNKNSAQHCNVKCVIVVNMFLQRSNISFNVNIFLDRSENTQKVIDLFTAQNC